MNSRRTFLVAGLATGLALFGRDAFAHGERHPESSASHAAREQQDWGIAGDAGDVSRSIAISMTDDMRFTPARIELALGETIRFELHNRGEVMHEMVIGTPETLAEHAEMMMKFPGMEHDEPWMAHVGPGQRGAIVWTFNRAGNFEFACLIAGHFQAGMKGVLIVR